MGKHRAEKPDGLRVRRGRVLLAAVSVTITVGALLGGVGLIPLVDDGDAAPTAAQSRVLDPAGSVQGNDQTAVAPAGDATAPVRPSQSAAPREVTAALPADSGTGRRIVFSERAQRVWLVGPGNSVLATYLVSGSVTNNLRPGSYQVYSRSRRAIGIDESGTMEYFVRFTRGQRAAIGFHSIPMKDGQPLQTAAQLGTPQSHGCIRQLLKDAKRLWEFAPIGTDVVVV